jgi:hypothetical protein
MGKEFLCLVRRPKVGYSSADFGDGRRFNGVSSAKISGNQQAWVGQQQRAEDCPPYQRICQKNPAVTDHRYNEK